MAKLNNYGYDYFYTEFYKKGKSTNSIARDLGVAGSSIVRRMRKLGFDLSKDMPVKCDYCGKSITRKRCDVLNRKRLYCSKECDREHKKILLKGENNPFYGKKHTDETKKTFSKIHKGKRIPIEMRFRISKSLSGENSPNWKNGSSERNRNDRLKLEYRLWRQKVFERDHYTCFCCKQVGGSLQVHHIENFSTNIKLRFEVDNGAVLCKQCHLNFHRVYGKQNNTRKQLEELIIGGSLDEVAGG